MFKNFIFLLFLKIKMLAKPTQTHQMFLLA